VNVEAVRQAATVVVKGRKKRERERERERTLLFVFNASPLIESSKLSQLVEVVLK
jgi:hypothetical protein